MPLRVFHERVEPEAPGLAAKRSVSPCFAELAPARTLLLAYVERGHGPGLSVSPWVRAGVQEAARTAGLDFAAIEVEDPRRPRIARAPGWAPGGSGSRSGSGSSGHVVNLHVPGARRPRRIPEGWFGDHLCLVVPCFHEARTKAGGATSWQGPIAYAFAAVDRLAAPERTPLLPLMGTPDSHAPDRSRLGMGLAASIFASVTLVLDASWSACTNPTDHAAPQLVPVGKCLAASRPHPDAHWARQLIDQLDTWLLQRLDFVEGPSRRSRVPLESLGSAATDPWPRAPCSGLVPRRSLRPRVPALWSSGRSLTATIPGPLARCWNAPTSSFLRSPS